MKKALIIFSALLMASCAQTQSDQNRPVSPIEPSAQTPSANNQQPIPSEISPAPINSEKSHLPHLVATGRGRLRFEKDEIPISKEVFVPSTLSDARRLISIAPSDVSPILVTLGFEPDHILLRHQGSSIVKYDAHLFDIEGFKQAVTELVSAGIVQYEQKSPVRVSLRPDYKIVSESGDQLVDHISFEGIGEYAKKLQDQGLIVIEPVALMVKIEERLNGVFLFLANAAGERFSGYHGLSGYWRKQEAIFFRDMVVANSQKYGLAQFAKDDLSPDGRFIVHLELAEEGKSKAYVLQTASGPVLRLGSVSSMTRIASEALQEAFVIEKVRCQVREDSSGFFGSVWVLVTEDGKRLSEPEFHEERIREIGALLMEQGYITITN